MSRVQKSVAKWVGAFLLSFCSFSYSNAQSPVITNPTFYDDTNVHVPLQFGFPFFGQVFTNSWMHSNGVVSFLNPTATINNQPNPGQWAYCCEGLNLVPGNTQLGPQFNYMIAPLWTDLYPVASSTFSTEGTTTYQRYFWNNIAEISNMNNLNTFSLEIRPTGFIGATYNQINIQNQNVTAGITGDISLGQMQQFYYGRGIIPGALSNWSVNSTPGDICLSNPLSSPTCPGYTEAMCTSNPLYNTSCSGYQAAYFTQQCSINPLYNVNCPGYATAYLNYQCSIDPLYATQCPGYEQAYLTQQCTANPLHSVNCSGYQTATTQCSINPLYASYCPSYQTATTQCSNNALYASYCPGYSTALTTCSSNPLSNTLCSGYTTASSACSNNQLTYSYCPSYTTTLAACGSNPQSNTMCPGYSTNTSTGNAPGTGSIVVSRTEATPSISSDGTVKAEVSKTGDSNVDKAISSPTTTANSAAAPAAPVQLSQPSNNQPTAVAVAVERKQEKQEERKDASGSSSSSSSNNQNASTSSDKKDNQPKTARQELQERRVAAARTEAVEKGKNLAENVGKAASMEQQVAVQNVVIAAMGYTPGFDTYNKAMIPDGVGYKPFTIYNNQRTIDNRSSLRMFGGSDNLHQQMIDSQYGR
jgi:hypothetical protein